TRPMTEGPTTSTTDLPVLLPVRPPSVPALRFRAWHGLALVVAVLLFAPAAWAQTGSEELSIIGVIIKWMPLLFDRLRLQSSYFRAVDGAGHDRGAWPWPAAAE